MARILVTGSTAGVGRSAAAHLLEEGHEAILHARSTRRAEDLGVLGDQAHVIQCWLATGADEASGCWQHMRRQRPDPKVKDPGFQDAALARFAEMTGVPAP